MPYSHKRSHLLTRHAFSELSAGTSFPRLLRQHCVFVHNFQPGQSGVEAKNMKLSKKVLELDINSGFLLALFLEKNNSHWYHSEKAKEELTQ